MKPFARFKSPKKIARSRLRRDTKKQVSKDKVQGLKSLWSPGTTKADVVVAVGRGEVVVAIPRA
jgi:hypothetical protein